MKRSQIYPVLALVNALCALCTFCLCIFLIQIIILFCSQLKNCVILKWFIMGYILIYFYHA